MNLQLPEAIYSPEQLEAHVLDLSNYLSLLRRSATRKKAKSANPDEGLAEAREVVSDLLDLLPADARDKPDIVEQLISELDRIRNSLPVVHVMLAAPPSAALKMKMVTWLRQNLAPGILVSFVFNRNIVGGMVLRTNTRIYDLSFRSRLLKSRDKIPALVRADAAAKVASVKAKVQSTTGVADAAGEGKA